MVSYPGTPGTIELLGLKDAVKTIGREYNTLTRYYRYHLSRPVENQDTTHQTCSKRRYYVQFSDKKKEKNCLSKTRKPVFGTSRQQFLMKQTRKKMASWMLKPQLLRAVLLLLPLVSCASTAIPFLGLLSSSAVLDVNFSERIREI